jgi:DNA-binding CsgD family transcriptional regulator
MFIIFCLLSYILYFFINDLVDGILNEGKINLFMIILILYQAKDMLKIYLLYQYLHQYIHIYMLFLIADLIAPIILLYIGPEKSIRINLEKKILHNHEENKTQNRIGQKDSSVNYDNDIEDLTEREIQIITLISRGLTSQEIADRLYLSKKTIDYYRCNIKSKLNLSKKSDLIDYYNTFIGCSNQNGN